MNWEKLRLEYPITQDKAYYMNAAVSGMHRRSLEAAQKMLMEMATWGAAKDQLYFDTYLNTREVAAQFIGATPEDIAFSPNSSSNMNVMAMMLKQNSDKRHVIAPADEFPSSTIAWYHHGFNVELVPADERNAITIESILKRIRPDTAAVVTSAVQFLTGFRQDLVTLAAELKKRGIPLFVNATQALGVFAIDVKALGIAGLTASHQNWP
jgi:selenocysteine lyase/cysteine desulfurase